MRAWLSLVSAATIAVGLTGPVPAAQAATTIIVTSTADENPTDPNDGDCSLREAIHAANSDTSEDACPAGSGSDTIVLGPGTYALSVTGSGEDDNETGDLDLLTSMSIQGAGAATTTINAGGIDRAFDIPDPLPLPNIELSGFTVTGGDSETPGDGGGAIFNQGSASLTLTGLALVGNKAVYGGAVANDGSGAFIVRDSLVAANTALSDVGGGFDIDVDVVATLTNVTLTGNSAGEGGGIWVRDATLTLNNVTVTGNSAMEAGDAGGVHNDLASITARNTIVAGNTNPAGSPDCDGAIASQGYNLIGNNTGCTFAASTGDKVGTGAAPIDPLLGPLGDNGGPTRTLALLTGSPAIDAGNPAAPGSGGMACAGTDQRGVPRSDCDMGAYELAFCQTAVVNRVGTPGNDVLIGTAGPDGALSMGGNDKVKGLGGSDRLCLGDGNDTGAGGGGKDRLLGELGKDKLKGQGGNDRLRGGPGRDTCVGGPGKKDRAACEVERQVP